MVERDQRVGVELGQCDVLGVKGVGPPEQDGRLPCEVLKDAVPKSRIRSPRTYSSCRSASFLVISPWRTAWYRSDSTWERSRAGARI